MPLRRDLPRFTGRPHLWLRPDEPLVCPNAIEGHAHRLRTNAALLQHDAFTCQHRTTSLAAECGATVYVIAFPGGLRYTAAVTVAELRAMRAKHMTVAEVLAYLGSALA